MKTQTKDKEWHFDDPRTRKWMVQCVVCQVVGYKHDAPREFFGRHHLVRHFRPLEVDEAGVCVNCKARE
jgi:hypothetical protein